MTKYYIETSNEDFIIDVPEGAQVIMEHNGLTDSNLMYVVHRDVIKFDNDVEFNDHVLARYQGVKACRSEQVKRLDPEVA